jgi:hypothetical protein
MNRTALQAQCEALAAAIAEEPRNLHTYWLRQVLEALEAEVGDGYEVTLTELRAEIDARLTLGEW